MVNICWDIEAEILQRTKGWIIYHNKWCYSRQIWLRPFKLISSLVSFCLWCYMQVKPRITAKKEEESLVWTKRTNERFMLEKLFYIQSEVIWEVSGVKNMIMEYQSLKFYWAGHVIRFPDNRWIHALIEWCLKDLEQSLGRLPQRWEHEIVKWFRPTQWSRAKMKMKWRFIMSSDAENTRNMTNKGIYK